MSSTVLATLPSGKTVESHSFGSGDYRLLIIGGVHGNEVEGVALTDALVDRFGQSFPFENMSITIIPNLNPDGVAAGRRQNSNDVDLNRNMPTKDWTATPLKPDYLPGPSAASEVESQVLVKIIEEFSPNYIVSMHSFRDAMINTNGECGEAAQILHRACGLPVKDDIGYPTPGSLGTYSGWERGIPTITLEVLRGEQVEKVVEQMVPALMKMMEHLNSNTTIRSN